MTAPRPTPATRRPPVREAALALTAVVILGVAGWALVPFTGDLPIVQAFNAHDTGLTNVAASALYRGMEPGFAVVIAAVLAGLVALRRRSLAAGVRFGAAVALTWLPVAAVKLLLHRPRPAVDLLAHPTHVPPLDWSFPSGHVTFVTALAVVAVLLARTAGHKALAGVLGVVGVTAMIVAVLVLGVHYPTDALASVVWACCMGPFMWRVAALPADVVERLEAARRRTAQAGVPSR